MKLIDICIPMNLPIVFLLGLFSYQLGKTLNEKPIIYFGYAWLVNFVHILFKLIKNDLPVNSILLSPFNYFDYILLILDYLNTYFFLLCAHNVNYDLFIRNGGVINKYVSRINFINIKVKYIVLISLFISSIVLKIFEEKTNNNLINYSAIPSVVISLLALLLVAYYFSTLYKREHYLKTVGIENKILFKIKDEKKIIVFGIALFGILQILELFNIPKNSYINTTGYWLSLFFKMLILIGVIRFFVVEAQKSAQTKIISEALSDIVGSIFHELTFPLNEIKKISIDYENNSDEWKMNKHAHKNVERFENNYTRIRAIVTAFLKLHENLIESKYSKSFEELFNFSDIDDDYHNLNNLIEICVQNVKLTHSEQVNFSIQYTKNPIIKCKATDFIQLITNLFKNSIDSFEGKPGAIIVNTKKEKENEDFKTKNLIVISIADNGKGIEQDILPYIFEKGFSTKDNSEPIRGYGLWHVANFANRMNAKITVESPYSVNNSFKQGTLFTLTINTHNK